MIELSFIQSRQLAHDVLKKANYSQAHIEAISDVVMSGQIDDCQSHGLYRLLNCIHTQRMGKVDPQAMPVISEPSAAIVKVDAQQAMAPLAIHMGIPYLVQKAKHLGIAMLAINRCVHFSALSYEVERLTQHGLVAFACTPSHAWVAPAGGTRPLFGTNPIAFGWPRHNQHPFVFDFATTMVARGEIELYRRRGQAVPEGWGIDELGQATTDPNKILKHGAMLTFGAHKGSALAAMVELLAGPLIGDLLSTESLDYDQNSASSPYGGELIIAFSAETILGAGYFEHLQRAEKLFNAYAEQGARLPSQRRYQAREANQAKQSIHLDKNVYQELVAFLDAE